MEDQIEKILERNKRVEADKAWETSKFRVGGILVVTYVVAFLFMFVVGIENAWIGAFVPTLGYLLSTLSLPPLKKWWIKKFYRK